ncbi:MAG: UDP-N-acetylmuramate dehydrogenase [Parvibaculum sp.]|nr:UDP-N-acetylmuramate dehydrogenase [Parvibaculum sp.]
MIEAADLRRYSRWKIGGVASLLIEPNSVDDVRRVLAVLAEVPCPKIVIGDGSNLLFDSRGLDGVAIRIGAPLSRIKIEGNTARVEAGSWVPHFARAVGCSGLGGIQHTIGIPGTVGGLILMNGGSQRKGIGENLVSARCADMRGDVREYTKADCAFSYRHSALQDKALVVLDAVFELTRGNAGEIRREMISIMAERRRKFPKNLPNCGSVFLSDPEMYGVIGTPGFAVEKVGLKGLRRGGAQISPLHANFIVNVDDASSDDVLWLIHRMRTRVHEETGFWMDCEVRHVAPDGAMRMAHGSAAEKFANATVGV